MVNDLMEKLYIDYYKELYLYAWSLCRDHYLAQDLASDTFFKAYMSLDGSEMHFKYWLFRVCKNLYIDLRRKEKEYASDELNLNSTSEKEAPLHKLIDSELRLHLFQRIIELPESYREILVLYYYCGFSIREISISRGITASSVKTLLFRARKKLKNGLGEKNEF